MKDNNNSNIKCPIGIFDSGIGGLTVFKEIIYKMPLEDVIYLGDTARVPYGIRSEETIIRYAIENTEFLLNIGIKMVIIACNTVSAIGVKQVAEKADIPVIGVIKPGAFAAVRYSKNKRIGVIGTEATINSGAYYREIKSIAPEAQVYTKACPLFVPLVEEGWIEGDITTLIAQEYLKDLKNIGIDTLVLGCTHYPLLKKTLKKIMGDTVMLIDSAVETAVLAKKVLEIKGLLRTTNPMPKRKFFVTDSPERFRKIGERFLNKPLIYVDKVEIPINYYPFINNKERVIPSL